VIITKKVGRRNPKGNVNAVIFAACRRSGPILCLFGPPPAGKELAQNSKIPVNIYNWSRPLQTGYEVQTEFVVTRKKRSPKKFLTGARTSLSDPATPLTKNNRSNPSFLPHNTLSRPTIPSVTDAGLNRQIHELELIVTCRKQKTETSSNRQKIKQCPNAFLTAFPSVQTPPRSLHAPTENEF
jgi:hypothetical protein